MRFNQWAGGVAIFIILTRVLFLPALSPLHEYAGGRITREAKRCDAVPGVLLLLHADVRQGT